VTVCINHISDYLTKRLTRDYAEILSYGNTNQLKRGIRRNKASSVRLDIQVRHINACQAASLPFALGYLCKCGHQDAALLWPNYTVGQTSPLNSARPSVVSKNDNRQSIT